MFDLLFSLLCSTFVTYSQDLINQIPNKLLTLLVNKYQSKLRGLQRKLIFETYDLHKTQFKEIMYFKNENWCTISCIKIWQSKNLSYCGVEWFYSYFLGKQQPKLHDLCSRCLILVYWCYFHVFIHGIAEFIILHFSFQDLSLTELACTPQVKNKQQKSKWWWWLD